MLPWSGRWDDLPAAHAASITFDLLCLGLLFLIGRRMRGPTLGLALAYAWAANPFTLYALDCNVNDALVAALVLAAIAAASSPAGRGALIALAGMAKFAPLALAPLFATLFARRAALRPRRRARARAVPAARPRLRRPARVLRPHAGLPGLARLAVLGLGPVRVGHGAGRGPGRAAVLLAVAVAFLPRRRDLVGLSALAAAVLIALQLGVTHWFYLYIVWFLGPLLIALLADAEPAERHGPPTYAEQLARLPAPAVAWR